MNQQELGQGAVSALLPLKHRPTSFSYMALIKSLQLESHFIYAVNSVPPPTINKMHVITHKLNPVTNTDQV
jgi:hypothetical protein